MTVAASASVVNGQISKVEFFSNGTNKIGEASAAPYTVTWANAPRGWHTLTAKATDVKGLSTVSSAVKIIVGQPVISTVVETGGDDEATDTIQAQWTGQTS